jgi:hypothetical protein
LLQFALNLAARVAELLLKILMFAIIAGNAKMGNLVK